MATTREGGVPEDARGEADGDRADESGAQGRPEPRVPDRDVRARHEHHQDEARVAQERERRVARVEDAEPGDSQHHSGQELTEDDGEVPAPRRGQQRACQRDRAHDRQVEERHERMLDPRTADRSRCGRPGMQRPPTHPAELACPCCLPALGDSARCRRMGGWPECR